MAGHRPEHGRQIDLPPAERADHPARPGRLLRARGAARGSAWSTGCSAGSAPRTISPAAARPSWSRWSRPRRSSPRRRRASFVILDEVGRGTSTYDGLAIAWAVVEAIHDRSRCRCLFATHYHELTRLAERLDAPLAPPCPRPRMEGRSRPAPRGRRRPGRPQLRHRRRQAGRPAAAGAGARQIGARQAGGRAAPPPAASPPASTICRCSPPPMPEEAAPDPVHEALAAIEPDSLAPREALELLYALKRLQAESGGMKASVPHRREIIDRRDDRRAARPAPDRDGGGRHPQGGARRRPRRDRAAARGAALCRHRGRRRLCLPDRPDPPPRL